MSKLNMDVLIAACLHAQDLHSTDTGKNTDTLASACQQVHQKLLVCNKLSSAAWLTHLQGASGDKPFICGAVLKTTVSIITFETCFHMLRKCSGCRTNDPSIHCIQWLVICY